MPVKNRVTPKRQATRRALKDREPKLVENVKKAFFLKGAKTSKVGVSLAGCVKHRGSRWG
jgi:hypothetical protein